jgi:SLBB domain
MDKSENPSLYAYEWISVAFICTFVTLLIFITIFNGSSNAALDPIPHYIIEQEIIVKVEGAVQNPGFYQMRKGNKIKDILQKVTLSPEADLRKVKTEMKLRNGQIVKIPHKSMFTIFLKGAVESPGPLLVEKETKLEDLMHLIRFQDQANLSKLKRKRRLKDKEIIYIPSNKDLL